jgi:hypothetical protein
MSTMDPMAEIRIRGWALVAAAASLFAACLLCFSSGAFLSYALMRSKVQSAQARAAALEAGLAQVRPGGGGGLEGPRQANVPAPGKFDEAASPPASVLKGEIINVNFAGEGKKGRAALGRGESDHWNRYHFPFAMHATLANLETIEGRATGALLQTHTLPGEWGWTCADPMWGTFSYSETDEGYLRFPNLAPGTYRLCVFAHGAGDPNPEQAWHNFSRTRVEACGKDYGMLETEASRDFLSLDWKKGIHYVVFENIEIQAGGMLNVTLLRGGGNAKPCINGLQLERVQ